MAEPLTPEHDERLSTRIDQYRNEAIDLVAKGIEHPCWELKSQLSIGRDNQVDRLSFIKLVQGLANAHLNSERFIVIGADQRHKQFQSVSNTSEFDAAKILDLLSKYLDPIPNFEAFALNTDSGEDFVLIALSRFQPRPIVAKTEGQDPEKKVHLRPGDIWVKRDTRLERANRVDLDRMFEEQLEVKAEARARRRFAHFREEILAQRSDTPSGKAVPATDLILGSRERFRGYYLTLISDGDETRFTILMELFRDLLMYGWSGSASKPGQFAEYVSDVFLPALDAIGEVGLLTIKNSLPTPVLKQIADVLEETYEHWREGYTQRTSSPHGEVPLWAPGVRAFQAIRALAIYSILRTRYEYLSSLQRRFVRRFTPDIMVKTQLPFVFWPFSNMVPIPPLQGGIVQWEWEDRISIAWANYFGDVRRYESAACGYELILELNSWVGVGEAGKPAADSFKANRPSLVMEYVPDYWHYPLDRVVPMAGKVLNSLRDGITLVKQLGMKDEPMAIAFSGDEYARLAVFRAFLVHIEDFKEKILLQQNRWPGFFEWPDELGEVATEARQRKSKTQ